MSGIFSFSLFFVLISILPINAVVNTQIIQQEFRHLDASSGLPHSVIFKVIQDTKAYIWIASANGLAKYDGYNFEIYQHNPLDSNSICNNIISDIAIDTSGFLWIATRNGLGKYNPNAKLFTSYYPEVNNENSLFTSRPAKLFIDQKNVLWISAQNNSIQSFDIEKQIFRTYKLFDKENGSTPPQICQTKNGDYWLSTLHGLIKFNSANGSTEVFISTANSNLGKYNSLEGLTILPLSDNKRILLGTNYGLSIFNIVTKTFENYAYDIHKPEKTNTRVVQIFEDSNHKLYIGTETAGLLIFDLESKKFASINTHLKNEMSAYSISTFYSDCSGLLWIGTAGNGIFQKNSIPKGFNSFKLELNGISANEVNSIYEDQSNSIWFGTNKDNLHVYNRKNNTLQTIVSGENGKRELSNGAIWSIVEYGASIWAGTNQGNVNRINIKNGAITSYKGFTNKIKDSWVFRDAAIGADGRLYILSVDGGLHCYNDKLDIFEPIKTADYKYIDGICLYPDPNQKDIMWIGSNYYGLFKVDLKAKSTMVFKNNYADTTCLSSNSVMHINRDSKGTLWIATEGGGLNKMDENKNTFSYLTMKDGLPSNNTYCIYDNGHGKLWISTSKGLVRYSLADKTIRVFDISDGIVDHEFKFGAHFQNSLHEIFLGGLNGFVFFHPDSIRENLVQPKVIIDKLFIRGLPVRIDENRNGDVVLKASIESLNEISLNYKNNDFTIGFSALHFQNPQKNQYKYKLEGFDKEWIIADSYIRIAKYMNLSYGKYIFRVIASNCDGVWNHNGASILIEIRPPIWQTWWFRLSIFIIFISLFVFIYLYKNRSIIRKNLWLQLEVGKRTKEIQNHLNEIETINNSLERQKEFIVQQNKELEEKNQIVSHINYSLQEKNDVLESLSEELRRQSDELTDLNSQLISINTTKDKLFSIIAHDLRNPFQGIIGFSHILIREEGTIKQEERMQYLRFIYNASKSAHSLLENLLMWAKTQNKNESFKPQIFDLFPMVEELLSMYIGNAAGKNIQLESIVFQNCFVYANSNMVSTIIRNLLNNAIKFTPLDGKITINAKRHFDFVELIVVDNGVGISQENLKKLFSIDSSVSTIGTNGESVTGLGLLICKEFAERNMGRIRAESEMGKGSRFILSLPAATNIAIGDSLKNSNNDDQVIPALRGEELDECIRNRKILIIDDSEHIRINIRKILEFNFQIIEAENGKVGFDMAINYSPDLIISDVIMPEMDGFELCNRLKVELQTSHIPIILLTSQNEEVSIIQGFDQGADEYIAKPFNPDILLARIQNLIKIRSMLRVSFNRDIVSTQVSELPHSRRDKELFEKIIAIVEKNISNAEFGVDQLVEGLNMSRAQLYRKFEAISGQGVQEFIRVIRLKKAAELISSGDYNVSEAAFHTGFNEIRTFNRAFLKLFGTTPGKYKK